MSVNGEITDALQQVYGPDAVIEYQPNHAGANKLNYQVRIPGRDLWLRVAQEVGDDATMDRWAACADLLTARYGAPRLLERQVVAGRTALAFELIGGRTATRDDVTSRLVELLTLTRSLHGDTELAARVGQRITMGASFRQIWVDRLHADLEEMADHVERGLHAWMTAQVESLEVFTHGECFGGLVNGPVHADLWRENVMVSHGKLRLVDWEDLSIGDPVVDDATLLWEAFGDDLDAWVSARPPADDAEHARFHVAHRAIMLDQVIDVLADAVETRDPRIAQAKRQQHDVALVHYRERYDGSPQGCR